MKRRTKILTLAIAAAAAIVITGGMKTVAAQNDEPSVIADNITIGGISVGGMSKEEAEAMVNASVETYMGKEFSLSVEDKSVSVSAKDLGIEWGNTEVVEEALNIGRSGNLIARYKAIKDLENEGKHYDISFTADPQKVKEALTEREDELNQEPVNYGLTRENGAFQIIEGASGIVVNVEESTEKVIDFIENEWTDTNTSIELAAEVAEPEGTEEQLRKVTDVLGTFSTDFSSSAAGRAKNVRNGCELINGSVIYPGEEFSVYDAVSPFDAEHGYELAGSYENGTTVETYGGGICQVSTTLYNAVIRAELEITERYNHSMIVTYVDPSADAAIAGTSKNLKFVNNTETPVYIEGYTNGGVLTFTVYGEETRDPGREIAFESVTTSTTDPGVEFHATGAPIGSISRVQSSHVGKTAVLYKVVKQNGVEVSREEFNKSTYKASPQIYEVGIGSANPEASAAMQAAVATNNEATIRAAAATYSDEALAAAAEAQAAAEAEAAAAQAAAEAEAAAAQAAQEEQQQDNETEKKGKSAAQEEQQQDNETEKKDNAEKKDTNSKPEEDTPENDAPDAGEDSDGGEEE